jgi:hypothetical protein
MLGGKELVDILLTRRRDDISEKKQKSGAIYRAVQHAVNTGDCGLLDTLDPERKHNASWIYDTYGYQHWVYTLNAAVDEQRLGSFEALLRRSYTPTTLAGLCAARNGQLGHLQVLKKYELNLSRRFAWHLTILQVAVKSKNVDVAKWLLDQGIVIETRSEWRPRFGVEMACFDLLKEEGYSPRTAFQEAVEGGNMQIIELLLDKGADVNVAPSTVRGATALQIACIKGYIGLVKLLISRGANVKASGARFEGRTALEGAAERGRLDTVQFLLDNGCSVHGSFRRQLVPRCGICYEDGARNNRL